MKTLGLLGGMSWESTVPYYRLINQEVGRRLGGLHSARLVLYSVDFDEIERLQHAGEWDAAAHVLAAAARAVERAGAEALVICTNTMHRVYDEIAAAVDLPVLHIADATGETITDAGLAVVGLLGTRFTMEGDFYRQRLRRRHGLEVLTPDATDRVVVHRVIYDELCRGEIRDGSRRELARILGALVDRGAEGVILGCTEISLLVGAGDASVPLFDTTEIHARKAVDWALGATDEPTDEPVALEVTDVLDLHTFPPSEVKHLVRDYLDLAYEKGLSDLRIIHGKGVGVQRRMVRTILERDPRVVDFGDPPGESGGWGATWVRLRISPLDPPKGTVRVSPLDPPKGTLE